ncbi:LSm family protein [Cohnella faecalis]|uniref:Uncharacterized protein n=1 Tax=Cohnella faecalis TaxID=2315694 RepID=A0A398CP72_9BACL|nr:LSm family protein [Cohnella faecalis]RIE00455.1 hypothetical protein D3H35_29050 [Cohnella faecalis]RIE05196.1 hypothetical protein D3H35_02165 [Cohnella faecalis]
MAANAKSSSIRSQAGKWKGQPVRVVLHDGRHYVGWIRGIEQNQLVLSGVRDNRKSKSGRGKLASRSTRKAKVSALLSPSAGNAAAALPGAPASGSVAGGGFFGLNGLDDWMGFMQKALPMVRMGVDMVKTIMPLLGGLKA